MIGNGNAGGRPTKLTPDVVRILRRSMSSGATLQAACAEAGIDTSTFYLWQGLADERGGLYEEIRELPRECAARSARRAARRIARASRPSEHGPGDWKADQYLLERAERQLRQLDEKPNVAREHQWRREEWAPFKFRGTDEEKSLKVEVLAHLEVRMTWTSACRAARVHRYQYQAWVDPERKKTFDKTFAACVIQAAMVAVYQAEDMLLRGATTLDKDGKVQATAIFGVLNAKMQEYGILKAQDYARNNEAFVKQLAAIIHATCASDVAESLLKQFAALIDRQSNLPPGAALR